MADCFSAALPAAPDAGEPAAGPDVKADELSRGQGGDGHHHRGHRHKLHRLLHAARLTHFHQVRRNIFGSEFVCREKRYREKHIFNYLLQGHSPPRSVSRV